MNILDKLTEAELREVESYSTFAGYLDKKKSKGNTLNIFSKLSSYQKRYFRFFCYGRFFCYFEKEPTMVDQPKNVILIDEITKVDDNHKDKKGYCCIYLSNGKEVILKHDNEEETAKWMKALTRITSIYKGKNLFDFEVDRKYKDKVDIRILNMIMEELESNG